MRRARRAAPAAGVGAPGAPPGRRHRGLPGPLHAGAGGQPVPVRQGLDAAAPARPTPGGATWPGCPARCSTGSTCTCTCRGSPGPSCSPRRAWASPARSSRSASSRRAGARPRRYAGTPWRTNARGAGRGAAAALAAAVDRARRTWSGRSTNGLVTARGYGRVARLAWTLADLAGSGVPGSGEVNQALGYRLGGGHGECRVSGRDDERAAHLVLARLAEPGTWTVHDAVRAEGAEQVVAALRAGRRPGQVSARLAEGARARAEGVDGAARAATGCAAAGARVVLPGDAEWPQARLDWARRGARADAPPLALSCAASRRWPLRWRTRSRSWAPGPAPRTARTSPASWRPPWPTRRGRWSAGGRTASTRRRTAGRSPAAGPPPWRSSPAGSTWPTRAATSGCSSASPPRGWSSASACPGRRRPARASSSATASSPA